MDLGFCFRAVCYAFDVEGTGAVESHSGFRCFPFQTCAILLCFAVKAGTFFVVCLEIFSDIDWVAQLFGQPFEDRCLDPINPHFRKVGARPALGSGRATAPD
nr:hypothetical protein [Gymnodinialimonas phycosphaerae]